MHIHTYICKQIDLSMCVGQYLSLKAHRGLSWDILEVVLTEVKVLAVRVTSDNILLHVRTKKQKVYALVLQLQHLSYLSEMT